MSYVLHAKIENDDRELKFQSYWAAMVKSYALVEDNNGWPSSITYGGIEVAGEKELNDFFVYYKKLINNKTKHKLIPKYREKLLAAVRAKVVPE